MPLHRRSRPGAENFKTYGIRAPISTHWVKATCAEVKCPRYLNGWVTAIDEATQLGQAQAYYLRKESGRGFTEARHPDGLTYFTFSAGQTCFKEHQRRLDRPEIYVVRGGDRRGNPRREMRRHSNADDWVDDFANHQDKLARKIQEG